VKIFLFILALVALDANSKGNLSEEQIKKQIIQQSIASYSGSCPCPYSVARNGSSCGARSAYSKPGGYDPICYPRDITPSMVQDYRRRNGL
jgi:hypothetical protein